MSTSSFIYVNNDSLIVLKRLTDRNGVPVTTATVTLESLVDNDGNAVDGVMVPGTLNHTSDGNYELLVARTAGVVAGQTYYATVRALYSGLQGEWTETVIAKRRIA